MNSVKILKNNGTSRITSADARAFKPRGIFHLTMRVLNPPENALQKKIAAVTPSNSQLKDLAAKFPAPDDWYDED